MSPFKHFVNSPIGNLQASFTTESQLQQCPMASQASATFPGYPHVDLHIVARLRSFVYRDLRAADLERMAPHLWVMSTYSSSNIRPLHHQRVKGRDIIVTEDPRLHLAASLP